jgi:hypothetical protein
MAVAALLIEPTETGMKRLKPREYGQGFGDALSGAQIPGFL